MRMPDGVFSFRERTIAKAVLRGSAAYPEVYGTVLFFALQDGVLVRAEVTGLPQGNGKCDFQIFAFHIHDGSRCDPKGDDPFGQAGGHLNPLSCSHPFHAGDMPPLFGAKGRAFLSFVTDRFALPQVLGKTVILHRHLDDFTSQPAGNAGEKIACGVIK